MKSLTEILILNGQDVSLASKDGIFEQRSYGRIFIPACFNGKKPKGSDESSKAADQPKTNKGVKYFSPYIH